MARLIVKSPYIKCGGGQNASGYLNYIASRDLVEIVPDDRPPTRKQEQLIQKLVKDFPNTKEQSALLMISNFLQGEVTKNWQKKFL